MRFKIILDGINYIILCERDNILNRLNHEEKCYLEGFYTELRGEGNTYYSEEEYLDNIAKIKETLINLNKKKTVKSIILSMRDEKTKKINKRKVLYKENCLNAFYLYKEYKLWIYSVIRIVPIDETTLRIEYVDIKEIN